MLLQLHLPSSAFSLAFSNDGKLAVGADDGSVRLYKLPEAKVVKAIRALGGTVSTIAFSPKDSNSLWIAVNKTAYLFHLDDGKLIYKSEDAKFSLIIGEDSGDDMINVLKINSNNTYMAFCCDSGRVGVVDLNSLQIIHMKTKHGSVCDVVTFIPDRPCELVSGGYDCSLLHYDMRQGTVLSRCDIALVQPHSDMALSPSFITCLATSSAGLLITGTADGRLWIGAGGVRLPPSAQKGQKKKRTRKWNGLDITQGSYHKIAEGPVVGVAFIAPDRFITCTLLGSLSIHNLAPNLVEESSTGTNHNKSQESEERDSSTTATVIHTVWRAQTELCSTVNALAYHESTCSRGTTTWLAIAGLDENQKGVTEVWDVDDTLQQIGQH